MKKIIAHYRLTLPHKHLHLYRIFASILLSMEITICMLSQVQADPINVAVETFATKSWNTGSGWNDNWYHEGKANITSNGDPHSGSYHMLLCARDAWTDRPLRLSGYNNVRLGIYVKVKNFEKNDHAELMIKYDDNEWETLREFTPSDSDNKYHYYEFDLNTPGSPSDVWIGFEAEMSGKKSYLYIDDIRFFVSGKTPSFKRNHEPVFGVTIDDISDAEAIKDSLLSLAQKPMARIVFDEYMQPSYYKKTVADIHTAAGIMGEILDSFYVKKYSQKDYEQRAHNYIHTMADDVDIWEVGNEINGEWLGKGAIHKAAAAYDIAEAAGEPTVLTLYYNGTYDGGESTANNCWKNPEHQMQVWAENNVPKRMKQGLDWVLVSFYEEDCENISPNWKQVFSDLHEIFPNSKLGFGEVGSSDNKQKEKILRRYYGIEQIHPEFIGGFFWWYFKQDMVPKNKKLWSVLNEYAKPQDE